MRKTLQFGFVRDYLSVMYSRKDFKGVKNLKCRLPQHPFFVSKLDIFVLNNENSLFFSFVVQFIFFRYCNCQLNLRKCCNAILMQGLHYKEMNF